MILSKYIDRTKLRDEIERVAHTTRWFKSSILTI